MQANWVKGGVCAPKGFVANGILAGIKKNSNKEDLALVCSDTICSASGVFTQNKVVAEPVKLTRARCKSGCAQAIIINSGNANACTGAQGATNAQKMAVATSKALNKTGVVKSLITQKDILVASTGVIGQQLPIQKIENSVLDLAKGLSRDGHKKARTAIMTTDTIYKECAVEFEIDGKKIRIGTMAKGSGMINPNMGTMIAVLTTDCCISAKMLKKALEESVVGTYNCVSVDGDTSTNDSMLVLANGQAKNAEIRKKGAGYNSFLHALNIINTKMARSIAADGEGAKHLIECIVSGAKDVKTARILAKAVISSSLVKAAFFGKDANWGRILCALGYSGGSFIPEKTSLSFSSTRGCEKVFEHGAPLEFDEKKAAIILGEKEIQILVELEEGNASGTAWGCDLTYEYVKINGDYRT
ncbi:MAG TPA: bifunctional glutamate N-acetyltransferase/amino-acid acetyltransferase ArgJ [Treponemataceae bacterium]|nr:bifunctional glutamate N-acetyltransferase/amino-acid acetyltransferase ArgJ [Treponemataceae bacterium]